MKLPKKQHEVLLALSQGKQPKDLVQTRADMDPTAEALLRLLDLRFVRMLTPYVYEVAPTGTAYLAQCAGRPVGEVKTLVHLGEKTRRYRRCDALCLRCRALELMLTDLAGVNPEDVEKEDRECVLEQGAAELLCDEREDAFGYVTSGLVEKVYELHLLPEEAVYAIGG